MSARRHPTPDRKRLFIAVGALALAAAAAVAGTTKLVLQRGAAMSAMNCEILEPQNFQEAMSTELQDRRIEDIVATAPSHEARFVLKGFDATAQASTLIVKSDSLPGLVYHGPFAGEIAVKAPESLFSGKGRDNFRIVLVHPATRQVCVAEHEAAFWSRVDHVVIELLAAREVDSNGLPVAFRVSLQP